MSLKVNLLLVVCCLASVSYSDGCTMEGVSVWQLPIQLVIEDYYEGVVLQRGISNILGYTVVSYEELNGGPYMDISIENSEFIIRTNEAYRLYEENETHDEIHLTFTFQCTGGTNSLPLNVRIAVNDNNNNDPLFKTATTVASRDTTYEFTIVPPVPPGFLITDCVSDIIVRDIDLTNYRIDFGIEENPYVEIAYDETASTEAKEYKATLRTTSLIRSLPEPIVLTISATDVDQTGDPPITTYTNVTIYGSSEFELPAEPVFSQAYYTANYDENNQISLEQPISLQQGYDDQVQFNLEGGYANNFILVDNNNQVSLSVANPLPSDALREGQIYLVANAVRADTSGASATIIVQLPEAVNLEFEQPHYEGQIVDNTLQLTQLTLSQGYQDSDITATVEDYPSFFTASVVGNVISLSMTPLDAAVIEDNNFINLRVTAFSDYSSATTIVTLEVVKEDTVTPVFEKALYAGTYDSSAGLTLEPLVLGQGYDNTVQITFSGEHSDYFELDRSGASSTLRVVGTGLPSHILSERNILLSVAATKPRTVGATAVVSIALPEARELQFEAPSYSGSLQDDVLTLETIVLNVGYNEDVIFSLVGDYASSFSTSVVQNQVTINLLQQLPQEVILEHNFLTLTVVAAGVNALSTTTAVVLEIIKDDVTTPVFSQSIYYGNYLGPANIEIGNINLVQGYDSSVSFRIEGENTEYFEVFYDPENNVTLNIRSSIPEEVIFNEKVFVFSIVADKPLTVGANAAISIKFPTELTEPTLLQFSSNTYSGSVEDNFLSVESIILETGFAQDTEFILTGEYATSFTITATNNVVSLSLSSTLPSEAFENNKFLLLELEARRERAVSVSASIIIDLVEEEITIPVFNQAFYTGVYTAENILQFQDTMTLLQGYDETVEFGLEGELSTWFTLVQNNNSVNLASLTNVPQEVLDRYHQLLFTIVANKPNSIRGEAAISIDLPKDVLELEVLRFAQSSYEGQINGSDLEVPTIILINEFTENIQFELAGAHAAYFSISHESNTVYVELSNNFPPEVLSDNEFLVLDITASKQDAISGYTTLVLSIVKEPHIITPVFEQAYYIGEYSNQSGLVFEHTIRLAQGFDETVTFSLQGDGNEWFTLTQDGNTLLLSVVEGGIQEIENVNNLIFSILANKPGIVAGQATIVIHLTDLPTSRYLRFSQNHYRGAIEEGLLTAETISLVEGYATDVVVTLTGDYEEYFTLLDQGGTYILQLTRNIPEDLIEANNLLIITIDANVDNVRTHATIVIELVKDHNTVIDQLLLDETYYVVSYSATTGTIAADVLIRVVSGYEENVTFTLQGDGSEWFTVERNSLDSTITISLPGPIPIELFVNNQPLIYIFEAVGPDGNVARATIVIALDGDYADAVFLGFEQANYLGTIENDVSTINQIILNEGYTTAVTFSLHGDLVDFFTLTEQGATVTVVLQRTIPEELIPANRIILLEVRATAPQAVSAVTTIVFNVVQEEVSALEELVFSAPFYTGQFSEAGGLIFETAISLDEGYDANVEFALDGDHAQWFTLVVQGNSVSLSTSGAIPPAILANNQQLIFVVTAHKPNSNTARATVVISLEDDYTDAVFLGFEQANYLGTIENDVSTINQIILNEGYTTAVTFSLHGDLVDFFTLTEQGATVTVVLQRTIPEELTPANRIILLEVRATAPQAVSAVTTIVFNVVQDEVSALEELVFSAPFYTGQFSEAGGLIFETAISLDEGYDANVEFTLDGDHAQWFTLVVQGNSVSLSTSGAIPPAILANNQQLIFVVTAHKPNSNTARATVVISLEDDYTDAVFLGFEQANYLGTIENDVSTINQIILNEGYTTAVTFSLHGDLVDFFTLTEQGATVTVVLQRTIPEELIPANRIILLEVRATAPQAVSAVTTIVFNVVQDEVSALEELVFSAPFYTGQFSEAGGLIFETAISLDEGYDANVEFALDGDHAQWFTLVVQGNSVSLSTSGAIPPAILANNQQLIFVVTAHKPNSNTARATVVISLEDDYTDAVFLGFEQANYLGTIENDVSTINQIILNEGYTTAVTFSLHGDLVDFFTLTEQGATVTVVLQRTIPEELIPANRIILLEVRATAPQAVSAVTTIVFNVVQDEVSALEELVFSAPFYTGQFSEAGGLIFETAISLDEGYDANVEFALDGDHAQWFTLVVQGNSVSLSTSGAIPPAILANNQQLIFVVTAHKPNSNTARATVVISLEDDYTDAVFLGFEQANYLGTIENDVSTINQIILNEGYTTAVTFSLHGDLVDFFTLTEQGATVTVVLQRTIPEELIPANRIILLEVRATAPQAVSAVTTIVFNVVQEEVSALEELVFSAPFYTGQFSEAGGLIFETAISLDEGYDANVEFALDGDHAQWFTLVVQGNSVSLSTSGAIPPAILANNQQLIFVVTAHKPNSNTARATVVISLEDDYTDAVFLGFEQANYLGTIENDVSTINQIILNEGYTTAVTFSLHGDLVDFFTLTEQGATVTVVLQRTIPEELIPANRIILLEVRATAPQAVSAVTTIVFNVVQEEVSALEELVFSAPFYTGQFSEAGGLIFETAISLDEGYDANVEFALDGDHAQWFTLVVQGNSVSLSTSGAIPPAILANNQQLIFVVTAHKPNSNTARATVVISLEDDYTDAVFLGFEQANYLGTIENDVSTINQIILNEGYTTAVTFSLHGDLVDFFTLTEQGATVTVVLQRTIPEELIPANRIILLEVRASAPQAVSAVTTIVFNVVQEEVSALEELVFSAPFYTGQFSEAGGLIFETAISLDEGYDANVEFALDGDHAQWFTLVVQGNSVSLSTSGAIPPAILANNQQLIFVVTAHKPNSNTARATVVISLEDDYTDAVFLGFEQANYLGTIENDVSTINQIILNEGYTTAVTFSLHGDLVDFFTLTEQGATVTVVLQRTIPEELIPANRIILLEVRATAPQAVSAVTTIVFNVVQEEVSALEELVFSAPFYTGQFSEAGGLIFETAISLDEGYDANVEFALDGDHAQWFTLVVQGNSVSLSTSGAIPPAILANNQQLIFVVTAHKPNSNTARATVVISLEDDYTDAVFLGFEQANYLGTIENDVSTINQIILNEGYTTAVTFSLHGDLVDFFTLTEQGATVTVVLQRTIPEELIPANRIILLEVRATAPQAVSAVTTIVFNVVQEEVSALEELVFSAPFYTGQFSEAGGLIFETAISLDEGYDANVEFALDGDHAQWFTLVVQGNSVSLSTSGAIPPAILANNQQLIFVVTAHKPNSNTARATVVISLEDDYTDAVFLGFEQANYLGTIENDVSTINQIILNEGYTTAVTFSLHGDLVDFFTLTEQGATVTVVLQRTIPEELIPANRIILLEVRATAPQAVSAVTTIVFNVVQEEVSALEELVFSAPFYTGQFSEAGGLIFETAISLDEGYDANVEFALDGDHAQWFTLVVQGNSVSLSTSGAIPPAILANNQQLIFVVTAHKPNSNTARATVVISLEDDYTDAVFLGFEQANYLGTIENDVSTINQIILNEGYTTAVTFSLHGDLVDFFTLTEQGATVTVVLQSTIPEELIPANRIILLEVRATAPQAVSAVTTIVFNVVQEEVSALEELVFSAPFYTGQFSEAGGLIFETAISLDEGYDANVEFALDGDHAQWFTLVVQGNSVSLSTSGAIPPAILANNQQLIFVVTAHKPNSNTARATVVISLEDDYTDAVFLGFEQANYLGTIENDVSTINQIILNEGYTTAVTFSLHGDLVDFFTLTEQGATVTVVLQRTIPEELTPANRIILLEVRATAPQAVSAVTTIVFNVVQEEVSALEELVFSAPFYTGQFSEAGGLIFETAISLDEGYDANVEFALDGDHAQWFTLVVQGNSVSLSTSGAIPPAILANNQQLIFVVTAHKPNSNTARATVVISLEDDYTDAVFLGFEQANYLGTIENDVSTINQIILNEGYTTAVTFSLHGDLVDFFTLTEQGATVTVVLQRTIPEELIPANRIILLEVRATAPQAVSAVTTIVFNVVQEEVSALEELVFSAPFYTGQFSEAGGLIFETAISLDEGYDANVEFALDGDHAQWFTLVVQGNSVSLSTSGAIPPAILANNQQLIFVVTAHKPNSNTARATVVISLEDDYTDAVFLGFEQANYLGTIENDVSTINQIILNEGYTTAVTFSLHGDLVDFFTLTEQGATVTVVLQRTIPEELIPANRIILLEVRATAPQAVSAVTTIVFNIVQEEVSALEELVFSAPFYTGQFSEAGGLIFETAISLDEGYDANVEFALDGDHAQWFTLVVQGNSVSLSTSGAIPPAILANNQQLIFVVTAHKPNSNTARATVVISLEDDYTDAVFLGFEQANYLGTIENDVSTINQIILNEGYTTAVTFSLHGDLVDFFTLTEQGATVTVVLQRTIPEELIPANRIILLEVRATAPQAVSAVTTIVFNVVQEEVSALEELVFSAPFYTGQFSEAGGLIFETAISLDEGYDANVEFVLDGTFDQYFKLSVNENSVTLEITEEIPPSLLIDTNKLIFVVTAIKPNSNEARTVVIISVIKDTSTETDVAFDKVLYEGTIRLSEVQHEAVTVTGFTGDTVDVVGDYGHLFSASVSEGMVVVVAAASLGLPDDVSYVPLELRASGASAVLLLDVLQSETPDVTSVSFGSSSYVLRAEMSQTGVIGQVSAAASNGERITYSLAISNEHLLERVSVNDAGEIRLSAPTNTGVYSFQAIATSIITAVQATAEIQLTVDASATCGEDEHVLPPLIILDRDEEEPHEYLVVLDNATQSGCQLSLTNRWPLDQDWLYVDENGLHARSIDREDTRIAFMALSQVQVELVLECDSDTSTRAKRSVSTNSRLDWLGPYEYGSNQWILTDTILYNSRRSFVNLIVNDINDNYPIFVGKENEPIVVGYPIPELEEVVLPRALAELKATDADVGENAELVYWSNEGALAVAPRTGSVHVRDGVTLTDGALLTVSATDRNGQDGLTGSIQLLVKLIDTRHIAVVTVRNAFLDHEGTILGNLTAAVGYEVKVLSSAVISDDTDADSANTRNKREVSSAEGATLQLYVYGVIDLEPVAVDQLNTDITENVLTGGLDIASTVSLEDHLEGREIPGSAGRDTGLLVATIVLSVLLFILIVAIAVWFFLRWRKARNYEEFSDANSLASRNEPLEEPPKGENMKKPRLNIEELKRSERRLQEMLEAPVDGVTAKPSSSAVDPEGVFDTIINMAPPDTTMPIVIQSIDKLKDDANSGDEDEYGERKNKNRRKSVVTFNENVEKIIHVEDIPDDNTSDVEVFRF